MSGILNLALTYAPVHRSLYTWLWVMVLALVLLSMGSLVIVLRLQRRSSEANRETAAERRRLRSELLRGS